MAGSGTRDRPRQSRLGSETNEADGPASLNSAVYAALKQRILENRLHPGTKLTHRHLAELLGVSRTPIREALERLYQDGFVIRLPRRGFFVAEIGADEARECYEMREALELFALRRSFAEGLGRSTLRKLEQLNQSYRTLVRDGATRERMLVDRDFHLTLVEEAKNKTIRRTLESVFERLILKIRVDGYRTVRGLEAYDEHVELLSVLKAADLDRAESILSKHIQGACRRLLSHMDEQFDEDVLPLRVRPSGKQETGRDVHVGRRASHRVTPAA